MSVGELVNWCALSVKSYYVSKSHLQFKLIAPSCSLNPNVMLTSILELHVNFTFIRCLCHFNVYLCPARIFKCMKFLQQLSCIV